jgi:hypothetical protein
MPRLSAIGISGLQAREDVNKSPNGVPIGADIFADGRAGDKRKLGR